MEGEIDLNWNQNLNPEPFVSSSSDVNNIKHIGGLKRGDRTSILCTRRSEKGDTVASVAGNRRSNKVW